MTSAFILNALSFVGIVVILWFLPPSRGSAAAAPSTAATEPDSGVGTTPDARVGSSPAGAATISTSGPRPLQRQPLVGLGVVQVIAGFVGGGFQVITVVLALDVLKAGDAGNGYLNAAIGIGGLLGGFVAGALVLRRGLGIPLLIGAVVTAAGTIGLGLTTNLGPALLIIGVASGGAIIVDVVTTTVFQRLVPNELRGRGTGVLMAIATLTGAAGALLLPIGVSSLGPGAAFGALGLATLLGTVAGLVLIGSAADRAPTLYEATMERVARLPLFAGVTRARLETAMHRVIEVPVSAGTPVVIQGEAADRFYIIESGSFTVSQLSPDGGPARVLRQLGENQVFGELGLLRREPRSATVTADTDGLLLALDRDDFLALVGVGELRSRMIGLYSGYSGTS